MESTRANTSRLLIYWGYSLRDGCRIDQMEGYPYSQRQAVCQYPSLETQNGSKDPWHSPTLQRKDLARLGDSLSEEVVLVSITNGRLYRILHADKTKWQCLFIREQRQKEIYCFVVRKCVVLFNICISINLYPSTFLSTTGCWYIVKWYILQYFFPKQGNTSVEVFMSLLYYHYHIHSLSNP